jgi:hypothetical protein
MQPRVKSRDGESWTPFSGPSSELRATPAEPVLYIAERFDFTFA